MRAKGSGQGIRENTCFEYSYAVWIADIGLKRGMGCHLPKTCMLGCCPAKLSRK